MPIFPDDSFERNCAETGRPGLSSVPDRRVHELCSTVEEPAISRGKHGDKRRSVVAVMVEAGEEVTRS